MRPTLSFALVVLGIASLACSDVANMAGVPTFDCAKPPAERMRVTPRDLVDAFGSNLVQAETTYGGGQVLEVVGEASRVSRDDDGAFIGIRSGPLGKGKVQAYFPEANATAFGAVQEGQQVTVLAQLRTGKSTEKRIALQSACLVTQ